MENKIKLNEYNIKYQHYKRNVKYPRLEYRNGKLVIITPFWYKDPVKLIIKKKNWVLEKQKKILELHKNSKNKKIIKRNFEEFKKITEKILREYSRKTNLTFNKIYYKDMTLKWASCSSKGNLTLNKKMTFLPIRLIKYIIFHELIHLKIRKHNRNFLEIISKEFPEFKKFEDELMEYWFAKK